MARSNLECFLTRTTPHVRSQFLPKTCIRNLNADWQPVDKETIEYFNLGDLWDCYDEWSAYGVGSPIVLDRRETVVQYYTPYLSAIQIYTAKSVSSRHVRGDSEEEFETKSWTSESEVGKLSRSSSSSSDKTWEMEELGSNLESSLSVRNRFGELYFEHFEGDRPFGRIPLKDKVDQLSREYPGLKSFNSVDLSPASWMAIAWYPIYHIPSSRHAKEINASFLTYHTLSLSFQDDMSEGMLKGSCCSDMGKRDRECSGGCNSISLPPFGLASYRMQPRIWLNLEASEHERISSLMSAADSWLKQLQVHHHDYDFFLYHSP